LHAMWWCTSRDTPRSSTAGDHDDEENEDSPVSLSFLAAPR
jgi:hypothetical protein